VPAKIIGITIHYRLDGLGLEPKRRREIVSSPYQFSPTLHTTTPPLQCALRLFL
jgi:hypothetical protein